MSFRVFLLMFAALMPLASVGAEERTESREQAVLQVTGEFIPGGLKLTETPTSGPCANLDVPGQPTKRGILDKGDVITAIEGKPFDGRRDFLDKLNLAHRAGQGAHHGEAL